MSAPPADVMRSLGNKISAREAAQDAGTPVMPATGPLPEDLDKVARQAEKVGYPLMLKASWGAAAGRGMRIIEGRQDLERERSRPGAARPRPLSTMARFISNGWSSGQNMSKCRYWAIVTAMSFICSSATAQSSGAIKRSSNGPPRPYLDEQQREQLCAAAVRLCTAVGYVGAGTVEFLMDIDTGEFYFIEVNPRIQVEHTVSEEITGIDIVKAQIRIAEGARIGDLHASGVPDQADIKLNGHALQCRITTEDPEQNFVPDYGRITVYRVATGFGIRLDGGTAYAGAVITPYYDSLLEKVTAWAPTPEEAVLRMDRALREFRIRGVATNLAFIENLLQHPQFSAGDYTTRFIDETPDLFSFRKRRDRATRLLQFVADISVNGNDEVAGRPVPARLTPPTDFVAPVSKMPQGSRDRLVALGPRGFADWMRDEARLLVTDTTMRDGHQSLLATRMRSFDMLGAATEYAHFMPGLLSLECWGGATFDVAMRFLKESPWARLRGLRERVPNILLQMLLRGANGVGYTSYPDNVVREFTRRAADSGIDLFRVFDSLNWVENMRVGMDAVLESGALLEAAICYTGDMLDPDRAKYDLDYYVGVAGELRAAGTHILAIKDMAGLLKPQAATILVRTLREETGLPIHLHTHDTSGISAATVLAAAEAGVDAVDAAMDSFSGMTSQPNLGSIVAALRGSARDTGLDSAEIRRISDYWEIVRGEYAAFESDLRFGASEVYLHEMPGGQFTNLREQARGLGLAGRWHEVARAYAEVNLMFGDIVKVTPSSKVVGDMALAMVSGGYSRADVEDPGQEISFPESVISFFRGELGQPPGGFPPKLQKKILKGEKPFTVRPGARMEELDLTIAKAQAEKAVHRRVSDEEFSSYLMYPKVFIDYAAFHRDHGPVDILPTSVFFYGMAQGDEIAVELERGKVLHIRLLALGDTDDEGQVKVFFELNGQPRTVRVANREAKATKQTHPKAEAGNPDHVAAPMPGLIATVAVDAGQEIHAGDLLFTIEAMKMETAVHAERDGIVARVIAPAGTHVEAKDLVMAFDET